MLILFALLLLCCGAGNVHCVHENITDLHSLLDFKKGVTSDPNGVFNSWDNNTHYCRWNGVICTQKRPWRVSGLNLTGQSLGGEITSSLANLTLLSVLDLSSNLFFGQLPPLGGLQLLETISLKRNSLEGPIPDALTNCSKLVNLNLDRNQLSGTIPPKIGFLSNLYFLDLSYNTLTGIIPSTFPNLTRLSYCNLRANQLEGSPPDGIWQLSNMGQLYLGTNNLSGEIPQAINMSQLQILGLEFNRFGKALPSNFGDALPSLVELSMNTNMFEGHIPSSLGNALGLQLVDLSVNHFTGQIPASLGNLSTLNFLSLEQNNLGTEDAQGWEFLHALSNCMNLSTLSVDDNQLRGEIPDNIGNLSVNIEYLLLGKNDLSGTVPATIGRLRNLILLTLSKSSLSGVIGEWIGNLNKLQGLSLSGNNFSGPIPSSIGKLDQLNRLFLQDNEFEALIPPGLGSMSQLSFLNLSNNNLQGNIPLEIGNLAQLLKLDLSSNKLTGVISNALGQCQNLITIRMDQNFLIGDIPPSFGDLKNLGMLDLSHNNLSGNIPIALNNLPLYNLDLSYNNLQGEIPRNGVFANATAVSLDGNRGLCGGVVNLHLPLCPTGSHKSDIQYYLVRILIPVFGFMSLVLLVYMLFVVKKTRRTKDISLTDFGENFIKVSYNDLAQATRNFSESNIVGRGSYGTVYRGNLKECKMEVAVKVFNLEMQGAERSFLSECEALRSIQHRNLLPIITACSTVDNGGNVFKGLVYEFMPNGNLDTWLHHKAAGDGKAPRSLGLTQRISVAVNIADALDYLHHDCGRPTVHCDLKPCNILLDDDMTALLGDFGIARFYLNRRSSTTATISSIGLKGTIGYIAPEYAGGGRPSTSGDVYSFGIVLLEMLTGKRPTDDMFKDGLDIVSFVESNFPHQIFEVIDPHLIEECKDYSQRKMVPENAVNECMVALLQVALFCTRVLPSERIDMKLAASKMHAIKASHLEWKAKKIGLVQQAA